MLGTRQRGRGGRPNEESGTMFETRSELEQLLAVAEEGRIVAPAALRFQTEGPGVALTLRSAAFAEGVRLLADGAGDLHWGGIDSLRDPHPALRLAQGERQRGDLLLDVAAFFLFRILRATSGAS